MKIASFILLSSFISMPLLGQNRFNFFFIDNILEYKQLAFENFKQDISNRDTFFLHFFYCCYDSVVQSEARLDLQESNLINASSSVDFVSQYTIENDTVFYGVFSFFCPHLSYILIKKEESLDHEQIHFDIAELYSRKIKKDLFNLKFTKFIPAKIDSIFGLYRTEASKTQAFFDNDALLDQISNPTVEISNKIWKMKIRKQLDSLKEYAAPYGKIALNDSVRIFSVKKKVQIKQSANKGK